MEQESQSYLIKLKDSIVPDGSVRVSNTILDTIKGCERLIIWEVVLQNNSGPIFVIENFLGGGF